MPKAEYFNIASYPTPVSYGALTSKIYEQQNFNQVLVGILGKVIEYAILEKGLWFSEDLPYQPIRPKNTKVLNIKYSLGERGRALNYSEE